MSISYKLVQKKHPTKKSEPVKWYALCPTVQVRYRKRP